jgi:hypothetical protein
MEANDLVSDLIEKAEASRTSTKRRVEQIRQQRELTPEARRDQIAKEFTANREELGKLQGQLAERVSGERRQLERQLWKSPRADVDPTGASWRAALDRADAIDNFDEAGALLDRAERSGDDLLAKAIALRSVDRWPQVTKRYGRDHPEVASAVSALDAFVRETSSAKWRVASSTWFSPGLTPPELKGSKAGRLGLLRKTG